MVLSGRTRDYEVVTPGSFVVVGVATAAYCLVELATATTTAVPATVPLLGVTAVAHVAVGCWLSTDAFTPTAVWRVGVGAATAGAVTVTTAVVVVPSLLGGVPSSETTLFVLIATGTDGALVGAVATALWLPSVAVGRTDEQTLVPEAVGDGGQVVGKPTGPTSRERLVTLHSLVRHNVRNRVNVIGGRLDLLLAELDDDEVEAVDDAHEAAIDGQLRAITELLSDVQLAVEALDEDRDGEPVTLASVVTEQATVAEQSRDGLSVEVAVDPELTVCADKLLSAVVENLLSNAVQHHDRETASVVVTAERDGEWVRLRVADDGPGIDDPRKKRVFEPEVGDGTGMGLYLVETLVDQYGGDVRLADNEPRGTVVELTLPRAVDRE